MVKLLGAFVSCQVSLEVFFALAVSLSVHSLELQLELWGSEGRLTGPNVRVTTPGSQTVVPPCPGLPPALPLTILSLLPCLGFFSLSSWMFQRSQEEKRLPGPQHPASLPPFIFSFLG